MNLARQVIAADSLSLLRFLLLALSLGALSANASSATAEPRACEFVWNASSSISENAEGSEFYLRPEVYLQVDETWTLLHFLENRFGGRRAQGEKADVLVSMDMLELNRRWLSGQANGTPESMEVEWWPLAEGSGLPALKKIGDVGGVSVYEIHYSPNYKLLVGEREGWTFCPVWSHHGGEPVELFTWEDRDYLSKRELIPGMGALQESYFFSFHEGQVRHLRVDLLGMRAALKSQGWQLYHRNGSFRERRLEWQNWAWKSDGSRVTLRVAFTREGRSLVMNETFILPEEELWKDKGLGYR